MISRDVDSLEQIVELLETCRFLAEMHNSMDTFYYVIK